MINSLFGTIVEPEIIAPSHALSLRPYQQATLDGIESKFKESKSTMFVLPTGCHAAGQLIMLANGTTKKVEDIKVGDWLMGPDSVRREVLVLRRGHDQMVRIVPTKGDPWIVNKNHVLTLVSTTQGKYPCERGGVVVDVSVAEWMKWPKFRKHVHKLFRVPVEFSGNERLIIDPYILGVLLGDGSMTTHLNLTTDDEEIAARMEVFCVGRGVGLTAQKSKNRCTSYVVHNFGKHNNPLKSDLRDLGLWGCDSGKKFIPRCYKTSSRDNRLWMLAGLMDTDGSMRDAGYDYISKSKALADDVCHIARSVGLAAYMKPCEKRDQHGNGGTYYRVGISGDCSIIPCVLSRKRATKRMQIKDVLRTGFTVETVGSGNYFGFTLDGDGRYLLDDFTVTHNCGKTICFAHRVKQEEGRVLVLAHQGQLLTQAADKIHRIAGVRAEVEQADSWADPSAKVIVSTWQTQHSIRPKGRRRERFDPADFSLVIADESHHCAAETFRATIEHYRQNTDCRILGCTATPDRADERALGQIFETVAYEYWVHDAIPDGWLVPVRQTMVEIGDLDYSSVRTVGNDLNQGDIEAILDREAMVHKMVSPLVEIATGRKTLVFCVTVAHAEKCAEVLNRWKPESARVISQKTDADERRIIFNDYRAGKFQFLCGVMVMTEGFDDPGVEVIAMFRPTKSRALYSQMVGRGLRPLESIASLLNHQRSANDRVNLIAGSAKPIAEVVDFVGNSGKHKLCSVVDILGGKFDDELIEAAREEINHTADGVPKDVASILEKVKAEREHQRELQRLKELAEAERLRDVKARASYFTRSLDPFNVLDIAPVPKHGWDQPPTPQQIDFLTKKGIAKVSEYSSAQAAQLIAKLTARQRFGWCTFKQARVLRRAGFDPSSIRFEKASQIIDRLSANNWSVTPEIRAMA